VMGEARDWDVFCTEVLPEAEERQPGTLAEWDELLRAPAEARRRDGHEKLVRMLSEPPFTTLVLGLAAWAEDGALTPPLLGDSALANPLVSVAPELLDRLARKVARRARHLSAGTDLQRHALRKSLKKLRYAIEDLAPLFPDDRVKRYVARCKKLLKVLGQTNDAVAGAALAQSLSEGPAPAIGSLNQYLRARREKAMGRIVKRWLALEKVAPLR
jgi:triphosphatase